MPLLPSNFEFPSQCCNCLSLTYYSKVLGLHNFSIIAKLRPGKFYEREGKNVKTFIKTLQSYKNNPLGLKQIHRQLPDT